MGRPEDAMLASSATKPILSGEFSDSPIEMQLSSV